MKAVFCVSLFTLFFAYQATAESESELFKRGQSQFKKQNFKQSTQLFIKLVKIKPRKTLYWFNLGNSYFMRKEYYRARKAYKKVILLKSPLSLAAKYYISKSYFKEGAMERATSRLLDLKKMKLPNNLRRQVKYDLDWIHSYWIQKAMTQFKEKEYNLSRKSIILSLSIQKSSSAYTLLGLVTSLRGKKRIALRFFKKARQLTRSRRQKRDVGFFIRQLQSKKSRTTSKYWSTLDLSYGWTDNFYEKRSNTEGSHFSQLGLNVGHRAERNKKYSVDLGYSLNLDESIDTTEKQILTHSISSWISSEKLSWLIQLNPEANYSTQGSKPFLSEYGLRVRFERELFDFQCGLILDGVNVTGYDENSAIDGIDLSSIVYGEYHTKKVISRLMYREDNVKSGELDTTNLAIPSLYISSTTSLSFLWLLSSRWNLGLSLAWQERDYTGGADVITKFREDNQRTVTLSSSLRLSKNVTAKISLEQITNNSNSATIGIAEQGYEQQNYNLGISWDAIR